MGMFCVLGNRFEAKWNEGLHFGSVSLHHDNAFRASDHSNLLFADEKLTCLFPKKRKAGLRVLPKISVILNYPIYSQPDQLL